MKKDRKRAGRRTARSFISLFTGLFLLFGAVGTMGCGSANSTAVSNRAGVAGNDASGAGTAESNGGSGENGTDKKAMGRYVESMDESLAEQMGTNAKLVQCRDGSLVIFSKVSGKWVSKDNGVTWEQEPLAWFSELKEKEGWIMNIAVSMDGYVGIIYFEGDNTGEEESANTDKEASDEETETEKEDGSEESAGLTTDDTEELHPKYMVVSPEGQSTEFEIPYVKDGYLRTLSFSDEGRLFGSALGGKIYEIDWEQGSSKVIADLDEWAFQLEIWGERMVCVTTEGIFIHDLTAGEIVEDTALDEFVDDQMGGKIDYSAVDEQPLLVIPGGEDILYLIYEQGIYRHVAGGNLVEQLADGTMNSLSNPSYGLGDGILLEDGTFLLMFSGGQLVSYTYDPNMPSTPDIRIRAYSLEENGKLKKAIAAFQAKHPEVYVRYEIGNSGDASATREDALKKLNTEIAAGTGPDLLLLDDMPMDSYIEKGILADVSSLLENNAGDEYFQNILRAFETEGKVYAVPVEFELLVAGGRKEDVEQMKDLASIAGVVEQYREEKPEGYILGAVSEKNLLKSFFSVCVPTWKTESGNVNEEELEEFFTQIKEIWDAEKKGITDKMREEKEEYDLKMAGYGMTEEEIDRYWFKIGSNGEKYVAGEQEFIIGGIGNSTELDMLVSFFRAREDVDAEFMAYGGQVDHVFVPKTIVGISQASEHQKMAGELLKGMMDDLGWDGFAVNKKQFIENLRMNATEDGSSYGAAGGESADGRSFYYEIYPATEEEIRQLTQIAEQANVPYMKNSILEDAVSEAGEKVLKGEMTAKEGVQEVTKRVSLYMAE